MKPLFSTLALCALLALPLSGCSKGILQQEPPDTDHDVILLMEAETVEEATETPRGSVPGVTVTAPTQDYVKGVDPLSGETVDADHQYRPIAVMIQNNADGYPQWGLKDAKVVAEAVSEGYTTSMMAMFSGDEELPERIGAVGEARDLFWQLAMPENSILMNIGSNVYANNLLNAYSYQNIDGMYAGVTAFDLDHEKDKTANHEFCWYTAENLLEDGLELYGISREGERRSLFNFADESQAAADSSASPAMDAEKLSIRFAEDFSAELKYDEESKRWQKYDTNGKPQVDGLADEDEDLEDRVLDFDNVVVLFASAGVKDDGYTRDYDLSEGVGLYLNGGSCRLIRWQKGGVTYGFTVYDTAGEPLALAAGNSYVAVYGGFKGQSISVKNGSEELEIWDDPEPMESEEDSEEEPEDD